MNPELFVDEAVEAIMDGSKSMEEVLIKNDDPVVCHRIAVLIGAFWFGFCFVLIESRRGDGFFYWEMA